ncbi:helix-turn-helix transcriptional regulator [Rhodococcus erythropolis]|uniref:helix-turn-helix transcriptional regulator n=1 Tax=Rhodococcus erythropolis TaxID=1833 RepID=UPI00222773DB|nr:helix-turn-helix transcriptional regulator [Rhodococcus erythropolis]MCW2295461.1 transcriptional regulator with XRE-family HTH domain [Rhodococcus erythropolis]
MDQKAEIREFLSSRRAKIDPQMAGLPTYGGVRRVPGLRREEVAHLAGVSVDYYTRLERGKTTGVSESVLDAVARALHLDEAERAHLFDLVKPTNRRARSPKSGPRQRVRPGVHALLDAMVGVPAIVQNGRMDILAANTLGDALYLGFGATPTKPANFARFVFFDPRAPELYDDWERAARDCVAMLRLDAGRSPEDAELSALVGELSVNSEQFRQWWARHDVRIHNTGSKSFHHPIVGDLTLAFESLDFAADTGQMLVTYTAEPQSKSSEALRLLASWSATSEHERSAPRSIPMEIRRAE